IPASRQAKGQFIYMAIRYIHCFFQQGSKLYNGVCILSDLEVLKGIVTFLFQLGCADIVVRHQLVNIFIKTKAAGYPMLYVFSNIGRIKVFVIGAAPLERENLLDE